MRRGAGSLPRPVGVPPAVARASCPCRFTAKMAVPQRGGLPPRTRGQNARSTAGETPTPDRVIAVQFLPAFLVGVDVEGVKTPNPEPEVGLIMDAGRQSERKAVKQIAALLLPSAPHRAEEGVGAKVLIQRTLTG